MKHPILLLIPLAACQGSGGEPHTPPEAAEQLEPHECGSVARLHAYGDILLASQPSPADLEQAEQDGIRTVLDIRHDDETPELDERAVVEGLGLEYVHRPWSGPDEMTDVVLDELRRVLNEAERPILFHCAGANRVGAVWLVHRALDGGLSLEEARAEARTVGLRSPAYEKRAIEYVRRRS